MTVNRHARQGIPGGEWERGSRMRMAHKPGPSRRGSSRKPQRRGRPKRRYDLLLPADMGAEVRLPAIPDVRLGARLLTSLLLLGILAGGYSLVNAAAFRVDQVVVHGVAFMSEAQVRSIAEVEDRSVFFVDPEQITEKLMTYPEVSSAEVAVSWPNVVVVNIVERTPVVAWDDAGRKWWLSADGVAFLERGALPGMVQVVSDEPVLRIQDDPLAQVIDPQVLRSAVSLGTLLPEAGSLRFERGRGLILEDARGWTAYFGAGGDMAMKVRVYMRIGEWLEEQAQQAYVVSISDVNSPYYTTLR